MGGTEKPMSGPPELARNATHTPGALPDSIQLRETICGVVQRECTRCFSGLLKALISTGSLARDEATIIRTEESWLVRGDAEFMLVFEKRASLPASAELGGVRRRIENDLLQQNIQCRIDLSAVHPSYFQHLPAHIFTYELKNCGQVIWGNDRILQLIPDWPVDDLSLQDAWRLLCNRMIEMLECAAELANDESPRSATLHYKILKLHLDMATSFLVFVRAYAPTYQERQKILRRLADESTQGGEYPFELGSFANLVADCTAQKLVSHLESERSIELSCRTAIQAAHALWRWELARLAGAKERVSDRELFAQWMRIQPLGCRVRGWVYVLRASGWHKSYRHWLHWLRLGWKASPRYWIYFVASTVLFQLTADESLSSRQQADWAPLGGLLPVRKTPAKVQEQPSWERLASDVVWNYREFLVGTRA
jgi:hypothetical protein